jgi:hypothetical protein
MPTRRGLVHDQPHRPLHGSSRDSHHRSAADVVTLLGAGPAAALSKWAEINERTFWLPSRTWKSDGYTGAVLTSLVVRETGGGARKIVVKVCPQGVYAREAAAHREALADAPPRFRRRHLVDQVFDPYPVGDGGYLMFQDIAGGRLDNVRPLSELPYADLAVTCKTIVAKILAEWNERIFRVGRMSLPDFLRLELRGALGPGATAHKWALKCKLVAEEALWVSTPEDEDPMPNVFLMAAGKSATLSPTFDFLMGRSHSDLHLQNVLVPVATASPRADEFWLVDLSAYEPQAPLTRDPVNLLLSAVTQRLPELSQPQREALLRYLVSPDTAPAHELPVILRDTIWTIYSTGLNGLLAAGWADEWIAQFLASLQAHAILFTSFDELSLEERWWFVRLAGHAAAQFLRLHDLYAPFDVCTIQMPQDALCLSGDEPVSG